MSSAFQPTTAEISGRVGQAFGTLIVPAMGRIIVRIEGDCLAAVTTTASGQVMQERDIPLQEIEFVELREGRSWFLLIFGILTLPFWLMGTIAIALFFLSLPDWVIIHTSRGKLILSYKPTEKPRAFCRDLLALSRYSKRKKNLSQPLSAQPQSVSQVS